jgi:hypothetical protein
MAKFLRYALATFCFAASVGCLALWRPSFTSRTMGYFPYPSLPLHVIGFETFRGSLVVVSQELTPNRSGKFPPYASLSAQAMPVDFESIDSRIKPVGRFGRVHASGIGIYIPLWYAALIFAVAGVAALRLGRRFTLRSAIIATTVLAGLLGMAVGL